MKKNLLKVIFFTSLLLSNFAITHAQMAAARSDAYQGDYSIQTGYVAISSYGYLYDAAGTTYTYTGSFSPAYPYWVIPTIHFQLYNGLKLQSASPTPANPSTNTIRSLKIASATTYPFFNSQGTDAQGNNIYNWANWMYPFSYNGKTPYVGDPATRDTALLYSPWAAVDAGKRGYQDYNNHWYTGEHRFAMKTNASTPTIIYNRINQQRDKIIIALWVGYMALDRQRQNAMMDLRVTGLDAQTKLYSRSWFSLPSNTDETATLAFFAGSEYKKILAANNYWAGKNSLNSNRGDLITNYNANTDSVLYLPAGNYGILGTTEGASEITGIRTIAYNNDPDPCGQTDVNVDANFRATTVGGTGGTEGPSVTPKFYHPGDPYQLSYKYFLKINITRPTIAFSGTDIAGGSCNSLGTAITMQVNSTNVITPITLNITDATSALLPGTETTTATSITTDASRVRVSLVLKSVYDAAVADGTIATNNDLATVSGFAYLTQDNFVALQNTIPQGDYVLKYDYSAPDSKTDIKTEGDKLGEVFAKSIYRPLSVTNPLPVTFGNITATYNNGNVLVNFTTVKETNNDHFDIELSKDGINFVKAGSVKSKAMDGNSDQPLSYSFEMSNAMKFGFAGISLFIIGLLALMVNRRNKWIYNTAFVLSLTFLTASSCAKKESISMSDNNKLYLRIAQVDKDGTKNYSRVVKVIQE